MDRFGDPRQEEPLSADDAMERLRHVVANLDQAANVLNSVIKTADTGKWQAASNMAAPTSALMPRVGSHSRRSRREPVPEPEASEGALRDVTRAPAEKSHEMYEPRGDCKTCAEERTDARTRSLTAKDYDVHEPREICKKGREERMESLQAVEPQKGLHASAARPALLEQRRRTRDARGEAKNRRISMHSHHSGDDKENIAEASLSDDSALSSVATYFGVGGHTKRIQSGVQVTHKEGRGCFIHCW